MSNVNSFADDRSGRPGWGEWEGEIFFATGSPANAREMLSCHPRKVEVAEIALVFEPGDTASFDVLRAFVNLAILSINHCTPLLLDEVLKHVPQVKIISINDSPGLRDLGALCHLGKRVEEFVFANCSGIETLEGIESLVGLIYLRVLNGNSSLRDISHLKCLSSIQRIQLVKCKKPLLLEFIQEMPNIKELRLVGCEWLSSVKFMFGMSNLTKIYLHESWNIPIRQLAQLRLLHPHCDLEFPWEYSKMRTLYLWVFYLVSWWNKREPSCRKYY